MSARGGGFMQGTRLGGAQSAGVHTAGIVRARGTARTQNAAQLGEVKRSGGAVRASAAFLIEAMLLLVFVAAELAVIMGVNAAADSLGKENQLKLDAVTMAANSAEAFAANPAAAAGVGSAGLSSWDADDNLRFSDDLVLVREVSCEAAPAGSLYRAHIAVWARSDVADVSVCADEGAGLRYELTFTEAAQGNGEMQVSGNAPANGETQANGEALGSGDASVNDNAQVNGDAQANSQTQASGNVQPVYELDTSAYVPYAETEASHG